MKKVTSSRLMRTHIKNFHDNKEGLNYCMLSQIKINSML